MRDGLVIRMDPEKARIRWVGPAAAFAVLFLAANVFASAYVSAEQYVYYWDYTLYWKKFGLLAEILAIDPARAMLYVASSIRYEDYTVLPLLPLAPFALIFGAGRLSYVSAIANVSVVPAAALMALVANRALPGWSWPRFFTCMAIVLCFHSLWVPALRGFPDALGVVIGCGVLLWYFAKAPEDQSLLRLAELGLVLCLIVLTRRWYSFWVAAFFPAALLAYLLGTPWNEVGWKAVWRRGGALALLGLACIFFLVLLSAPLLARAAFSDYSTAFAAYRAEVAGAGPSGQVLSQFGIGLSAVSAFGLAWLVRRPRSRELGILILAQATLSLALFMRVQELMGVQHFYLLVPAVGIGLASAVCAAWEIRAHTWRWVATLGIAVVVILSSATVLAPSPGPSSVLLPQVRHAPLVRPDVPEIDRLLDVLADLNPQSVYVAASSEILNWDTLQTRCTERRLPLCPHLAMTADIDTRDGFPQAFLGADTVVLATPTQYHVRPQDQQVVGLIARDIREHRGMGSSFEAHPGEFALWRGVRVTVFRRVGPLRNEDVQALGDELARSYPQSGSLFEPPSGWEPR